MTDLVTLREEMRRFSDERDWSQFHDPKSLALALVGEVGELAELMQWLPAAEAAATLSAEPLRARAAEELADVLLYLVRLADVLQIDLGTAAKDKLAAAEERFGVSDYYAKAPEKS